MQLKATIWRATERGQANRAAAWRFVMRDM